MMLELMIAGALAAQDALPTKEDGEGWHTVRVKMMVNGDPVPGMNVTYTEDDTRPGAALYCREDTLRVRFSLEGRDLRETIMDFFPRGRRKTVTLLVSDEAEDTGTWTYLPEHKLLVSNTRTPAAKVFNAVIKGEPVAAKRGRTVTDIALPPVDDEFREFVAACKERGAI